MGDDHVCCPLRRGRPSPSGLALLAPALGAVVAMPLVGRLLPGRSSRAFCRIAIGGSMAAILLPALSRSVPALAGALFVVGVANSTLDLVMNAQGVSIERWMGRPILSSLHAAFSFGGFAGAGLVALAAALGFSPLPHLAAAAAVRNPRTDATGSLLARDEDADAHGRRVGLERKACPRQPRGIGGDRRVRGSRPRPRPRRRRPDCVSLRRRRARSRHRPGPGGGQLTWLSRLPRRPPADRRPT